MEPPAPTNDTTTSSQEVSQASLTLDRATTVLDEWDLRSTPRMVDSRVLRPLDDIYENCMQGKPATSI
ncbi:Protein of unknown function [Pyronema omphalodes CBS 100304]|uniref:Uncharacterized protein n=1 Tax=Pyronema omphalodes (strain CBS 100304) TaxID=1076935 RepID=U4KWT0_PYROM|nr:Protein of unknown function [Pyronema omphalodes CBS 100304]